MKIIAIIDEQCRLPLSQEYFPTDLIPSLMLLILITVLLNFYFDKMCPSVYTFIQMKYIHIKQNIRRILS